MVDEEEGGLAEFLYKAVAVDKAYVYASCSVYYQESCIAYIKSSYCLTGEIIRARAIEEVELLSIHLYSKYCRIY